jgi:hypothetical protein|tara:strand:+ start:710 stop:946 length:237 start_codon:yes stop_codon:yes gene_type:complete
MKILRTKVEAAEVVVDRAQAAEAGDRADEVAAADLTTATTARKSANTGRSEDRIRHTKGGNPRKGEKEAEEEEVKEKE